jgi:hypothetical protein
MPVDYGYYQYEHDQDFLKHDIGQSPVHVPPHYTYPAIPSQDHIALPLSPQSFNQNANNMRTSLSDIDEALESAMMSPGLDSFPEQNPDSDAFQLRIPHPELLPDNTAQMPRQASYCLDDFVVQRTLGTGSFGRVHLSE